MFFYFIDFFVRGKAKSTVNLKIGFFEVTGAFGGYATIVGEQAVTIAQLLPLLTLMGKGISAVTSAAKLQSIGKAIKYTYGIYPRLARYVIDGRYRIDNNLAENAVRPLALGCKNYLFCQNHEAAGRTAVIYSLLGTCKIWGVNPTLWLTDVLSRIQDHSVQRLDELLPDNWVPSAMTAER